MTKNNLNDIELHLKLTLEEMYFGLTKEIKYKRKKPCSTCNNSKGCTHCKGQGIVLEESLEEIKIPAGVGSDMVLNFKNKGHAFKKERKRWNVFSNSKIEFGSLILSIEEVKHDLFRRVNDDLVYIYQIKPFELNTTGKLIEIQHLDKELIKVQIPPNISNGNILRIPEKGFKNVSNQQNGALLIIIKVEEI